MKSAKKFACLLVCALIGLAFGATSASAAPAYSLDSGRFGGGGVSAFTSFSIEAFDSLEVKRIKSWFYSNFTSNQSGTAEVWYKPGKVQVATASNSGWKLAVSTNMTFNWNSLQEIDMDINVVVPQGVDADVG